MRESKEFFIPNKDIFLRQLINWGNQFNHFIVLNSNNKKTSVNLYPKYEIIAGVDSISILQSDSENCFEDLRKFNNKTSDWMFGYLSYDLKNEIENLQSEHFDGIGFQKLLFFVPRYVLIIKSECLVIEYLPEYSIPEDLDKVFEDICQQQYTEDEFIVSEIKPRFTLKDYIHSVEEIKKHIVRGNIYELNFCQEFYIDQKKIAPQLVYNKLNSLSPSPFSCYLKTDDKFLISSSPERFLAKRKSKIISQPIKGTIKRGKNKDEDRKLALYLQNNEKERAENIMIVDLVRNDLSHTALIGSVEVQELCKIYHFEHVHQMISTVVSELDEARFDLIDLIKSTFPMGSMTGAPKIKAMELIEKYERTRRGLYSGSVGYICPEKDFDFNVVIRSILYNQSGLYTSFMVGSAITAECNAKDEYNECLLKAEALIKALG
jgi:para-aminobenzoate synthetase component 1